MLIGTLARTAMLSIFCSTAAIAADAATEEPTQSAEEKSEKKEINPRYETDFTAYTVDKGTLQIGTLNFDYGLSDNTQIGTSAMMDYIGFLNVHGKMGIYKGERLDVSLAAMYSQYDASAGSSFDRLDITYMPFTLSSSVIVTRRWSLHAGYRWDTVRVNGAFDISTVGEAFSGILGEDVANEIADELVGKGSAFGNVGVTVGQIQLGTDFRINHRDSIIFLLRAYAKQTGRIDVGYADNQGLMAGLSAQVDSPILDNVTPITSLSYQATLKDVSIRLGWVLSSPPLPSADEEEEGLSLDPNALVMPPSILKYVVMGQALQVSWRF